MPVSKKYFETNKDAWQDVNLQKNKGVLFHWRYKRPLFSHRVNH